MPTPTAAYSYTGKRRQHTTKPTITALQRRITAKQHHIRNSNTAKTTPNSTAQPLQNYIAQQSNTTVSVFGSKGSSIVSSRLLSPLCLSSFWLVRLCVCFRPSGSVVIEVPAPLFEYSLF